MSEKKSKIKESMSNMKERIGDFADRAVDVGVDITAATLVIGGLTAPVTVPLAAYEIYTRDRLIEKPNNEQVTSDMMSKEKYTVDESLKLYTDIENSKLANLTVAPNDTATITNMEKEVYNFLSRVSKENIKLRTAYVNYYGSEQNIPDAVAKVLNNQLGYKKKPQYSKAFGLESMLCFINKSDTGHVFKDIAKANFDATKDGKKRQLDLQKKPYYVSEYNALLGLMEEFNAQGVQKQAKQCVNFMSTGVFGTEDMKLGLLMLCKNQDMLNLAMTRCANKNNINVPVWVKSYVEQVNQGKDFSEKVVSIGEVNYILPDEPELTK